MAVYTVRNTLPVSAYLAFWNPQVVSINDGSDFAEDLQPTIPTALAISTVAPNPFNPRTTVWLDMPRSGAATLSVHDLRGGLVRTLRSGQIEAGRHPVAWDGMDDRGYQAASGVYLIRLATSSGEQRAVKVTLAK